LIQREEVRIGLKKLHNDTFHNPYCSSDIITLITSRRIQFCGARNLHGEMSNAYKASGADARRRDYFGDVDDN
jgi:hypothetical protein